MKTEKPLTDNSPDAIAAPAAGTDPVRGEIETISRITAFFPRSPQQVNGLQESDAEILEVGGTLLALNVDEFSDGEDFFRDTNPEILGWNIACGVLSDLLAVGATPRFVAQSCVLTPKFEGPFGESFFRGISSAVSAAGAFLVGGDTSNGVPWRYTGIAIGDFSASPADTASDCGNLSPPRSGTAILRSGIVPGDRLYLTGSAGAGNLMALQKIATSGRNHGCNCISEVYPAWNHRFPLRLKTSRAARQHARACIDTSDGFARALEVLSMMNRTGFVAAPGLVPLCRGCAETVEAAGMPKVMALLGSAGEYELLVTVPMERAPAFLKAAGDDPVTLVGVAVDVPGVWFASDKITDPGKFISIWGDGRLGEQNPVASLPLPLPDPRGPGGIPHYLRELRVIAARI